MKDMYGLDVPSKLRELNPDARVMAVSADVQISSHEMAAVDGAPGVVVKPLDPDEIVVKVNATLSGAR